MIKIAIIGSRGFIGKHLDLFLRKNLNVIPDCYDIVDSSDSNYHKINLMDKESISQIDLDVDCIYVMAGMTGTKEGFLKYEQFININEIALLNLLDVIRLSKYRPKIIFPSSRLVYKGSDRALKESDLQDSKTIYAVNKIACESYLKVYNYNFGINYTIFRICVPYGNMIDNDYSFGTVGFFIKMAQSKKDITLYGGGLVKRTFSHLEDICHQMVYGALNEKSNNEVYNIGGEACSLYDVASIIAKKYGVNVISVPWPNDDLKIESGNTYFNDSKIQELLGGYNYKHQLVEIIK